MRVGIDQPGNEGDLAEIGHIAAIGLRADCDDPLAIDCHDAVFDRRLIDGKDNTSLQRKRHDAIVAEFARIRPSRCKDPNFCKFSYAEAQERYSALLDALAASGWCCCRARASPICSSRVAW